MRYGPALVLNVHIFDSMESAAIRNDCHLTPGFVKLIYALTAVPTKLSTMMCILKSSPLMDIIKDKKVIPTDTASVA